MPYPFRWTPGEGERHATGQVASRAGIPAGMRVRTLCGTEVVAAEGDLVHLWPACPRCAWETSNFDKAHNSLDTINRTLLGLQESTGD